jgi:hypothetical protein
MASVWASFSLHALNYETPPSYHDSHMLATFFSSITKSMIFSFVYSIVRGVSSQKVKVQRNVTGVEALLRN